jgi:hypothetical protein
LSLQSMTKWSRLMSITELSIENSFFTDFMLDLPFPCTGEGINGGMASRLWVYVWVSFS